MLGVDLVFQDLVGLSELLSVCDHLLNLFLGESTFVVGDGDGLLLVSTLLVGGHSQYGVLIDFEGNINLGDTAGSWGDAVKIEFAELMVVLAESTLTFEDCDGDSGLLILVCGKGLGLLAGNHSAAGDDLGHNSADSLYAKGKRGDINEEKVLGFL